MLTSEVLSVAQSSFWLMYFRTQLKTKSVLKENPVDKNRN